MRNVFLPSITNEALPFYPVAVGELEEEQHVKRGGNYLGHHLMLSKKGRGKLVLDGREYIIEENSLFFIHESKEHSYYPLSEAWHTAWIIFKDDKDILTSMLRDNIVFDHMPVDLFYRMFEELYREGATGGICCTANASALLYSFVISLVNNYSYPMVKGENLRQKLVEYIQLNCHNNIGLDDMAEYLNISRQHLCRLFKAGLNTTPCAYLTSCRIKKAKERLALGQSVQSTAEALGFGDSGYFCRVFKKNEGMTPTEFRERFARN